MKGCCGGVFEEKKVQKMQKRRSCQFIDVMRDPKCVISGSFPLKKRRGKNKALRIEKLAKMRFTNITSMELFSREDIVNLLGKNKMFLALSGREKWRGKSCRFY